MPLLSLSDRIGMQAVRQGTEDVLGTCTDILIDVENGRLVCALFELGHTHGCAQAMFAPEKFEAGDDAVILAVGDEEIAVQTKHQAATGPRLDTGSLPPVVVGPFGYTIAPAMASALLNAVLGRRSAKPLAQPDLDKKWSTWHWFTNLQSLPVFDVARSLGKLADIHVDRKTWTCQQLETVGERQDRYMLPFAKLRNVDLEETSIIMEMSETPPYSPKAILEDLKNKGGRAAL
jgi:hypothetical protein